MNNNEGKLISGKLMGKNTLFWQFPQVRHDGSTIIKRRAIRPLQDNEKVVNGKLVQIDDQPDT